MRPNLSRTTLPKSNHYQNEEEFLEPTNLLSSKPPGQHPPNALVLVDALIKTKYEPHMSDQVE